MISLAANFAWKHPPNLASHSLQPRPRKLKLDLLKTKAMLYAQKKCKHLYMGTVSFSEAVDLPRKRIQFWTTALRRRKGCKVSVNLWKCQKKKANADVPS